MGIGGFHKQQRRKMVKSEAGGGSSGSGGDSGPDDSLLEDSTTVKTGDKRKTQMWMQSLSVKIIDLLLNIRFHCYQQQGHDRYFSKFFYFQWERSSWSLGSNSDRSRGKVPVFQVLAVLLPSRDRAARDAVWCLSAAVAAYVGLVNHIIYKDHFLEKVDFLRFKMLIANWDCFCKWFFKWALQNSDAVRALKAADFFRIQMLLGLMWDW
ncbi:hypothetical protein LXL04_003923 [Taraxacum kok-saghyz]